MSLYEAFKILADFRGRWHGMGFDPGYLKGGSLQLKLTNLATP